MKLDQVKSCGVIVFRNYSGKREFLLMRHHHRWDLPKGHVDPGETELECALRELWEETGIPADAIQLDPGFRFTLEYPVFERRLGKRVPKLLVVFMAELQRAIEIKTTEHPGFSWIPWEPPHSIQVQTVDPLLASIEAYLKSGARETE